MSGTFPPSLAARQTLAAPSGTSAADQFLSLIANPYASKLSTQSIYASFGYSLVLTTLGAIAFCILRPRIASVYAPRLKAADEKHAPPKLGNGLLDWIRPIKETAEIQMIEKVGLDATLFLRFTRMLRNIFLVLSIFGCAILIPVNLIGNHSAYDFYDQIYLLMRFTPQFIGGSSFWAFVAVVYIFDAVICYFLWLNYRIVTRLRKSYFESEIYRSSLHSRTLMLTEIPKNHRTDDGIIRIVEEARPSEHVPRAAIARNVRDLPYLIEEYEEAVKDFEAILAKYLRNPEHMPAKRPTCKPSKHDRREQRDIQVDAIEYFTTRIRSLESEIKQVRETLDQRNPMSYGFASYPEIEEAHVVAFASRNKNPQGATIRLAPKPNDLIWKNLTLTPREKSGRERTQYFWLVVLTIIYIPFNALSAVFLANLHNLGVLWPAFQTSLEAHVTWWSIVQGIMAPLIQTLIYLGLPVLFRRFRNRAGDTIKSSRERHVTSKLYGFFVINNLIVFSLFSTLFSFLVVVIKAKNGGFWTSVKDAQLPNTLILGLCNISPFWVTWLLQRNLGAAVDLLQLWQLFWGTLMRKFTHPTPRKLIELSAPPTFEYAEYYNYFLFYSTVGLCFATLQPIVLPVTALYFVLDAWLKKYLFLYVTITKTESGGTFWRILFNRMIFATILSNCVVALLTGIRGGSWVYPVCIAPSPLLLLGFKYYCSKAYDNLLQYCLPGSVHDPEGVRGQSKRSGRNDRVAVRFGNPALYKKLITPMVDAKSQNLLRSIYRGRLDEDETERPVSVAGYSDIYMTSMSQRQFGKRPGSSGPFEFVSQSEMDFENFKRRSEFRDEFGGDGELYGRPEDYVGSRPSTPSTFTTMDKYRTRSESADSTRHSSRDRYNAPIDDVGGTVYPAGYHQTPANVHREQSPGPRGRGWGSVDITGQPSYEDVSRGRLMGGAAPMGRSYSPGIAATPQQTPGEQLSVYDRSLVNTPDEDTSYDYFRRGRRY